MVKIIIKARDNELLNEVIGDIDISEYESQKWLHGIVGAIVAHDLYGITSKDVLKAIRYHKVGNISDPIFTKILITADIANNLRRARYMITAYTMLKMDKFAIDRVYENIIKYDTYVAVANEDVVIPRMLKGARFKVNKLDTCKVLPRLTKYYLEDAEYVWVPAPADDGWKRISIDAVYVTPGGFANAAIVMDNITHDKEKYIILTMSDKDWSSYMISYIDTDNENQHLIIPFSEANASGVTVPRGFYPKTPTRYIAIDSGELQ